MSKLAASQVITCKAAVCWAKGEAVKLEEIQVDPPKSSEVRVKMIYSSLCHTDILLSRGHLSVDVSNGAAIPASRYIPTPGEFLKIYVDPLFPRVLGHEGVGEVESIGNEVKALKVGDLVIPVYIGECKECENCTSGKTNLCLKYPMSLSGLLPDGTSRMSIRGERLYHLLSCSTWSEYTVMDSNFVVKVEDGVDLAHATFLSCGYSTGFGAAWKEAKVEVGSTVAVIGLGAVGLGVVEGARLQGAARIIGVDINDLKKNKAKTFGLTDFINPLDSEEKSSAAELIKSLTSGLGVDYCFECSGVGSMANQALLASKPGKGMVILVGAAPEATLEIASLPLLIGGTIKGTCFGGLHTQSDVPTLLQKSKNKELHLDELLTHRIKLDDITSADKITKESHCVKILIKI